jgi:hypothetical protein
MSGTNTLDQLMTRLRELNTPTKADFVLVNGPECPFVKAECDTLAARTGNECGNTHHADDEHDFASYDSSDIHLRTQEWERQARFDQCDNTCTVDCGHCKGNHALVVEFHAPAKLPITQAQRLNANDAIKGVFPGVQLGSNLSQRKAHEILASYVGLNAASNIMASA